MKKIIIAVLILMLVAILILSILILNQNQTLFDYSKLENLVMENSNWISISKEDINGYVANSYTLTISTIISSLENAIPVILEVSQNKFSNDTTKGTFIILSAFTENNNVIFYYFDDISNKYIKTESNFGSILENATSAFIVTNPEVLK